MIDPAAGILLISDPFLKDPNFMRTVVFLCEHQQQGSFGFHSRADGLRAAFRVKKTRVRSCPAFLGDDILLITT